MEKNIAVEPYYVILICDECQQGEMEPTGHMTFTHPSMLTHQCSHCAHIENYLDRYPLLQYRRI